MSCAIIQRLSCTVGGSLYVVGGGFGCGLAVAGESYVEAKQNQPELARTLYGCGLTSNAHAGRSRPMQYAIALLIVIAFAIDLGEAQVPIAMLRWVLIK